MPWGADRTNEGAAPYSSWYFPLDTVPQCYPPSAGGVLSGSSHDQGLRPIHFPRDAVDRANLVAGGWEWVLMT